ncbi:hypothetical protein C2S53_016319 [Perilla frutescens var. hirtella]|uniref:Uncharacterized protein n=1 Tax=Perilla frutescens var. hirtella TaxID=608512 RepID=A0AAD4NY40_PERFH|nr:hypothetical protein C2S53_016319 [Perilla frutescens var. hirtella]
MRLAYAIAYECKDNVNYRSSLHQCRTLLFNQVCGSQNQATSTTNITSGPSDMPDSCGIRNPPTTNHAWYPRQRGGGREQVNKKSRNTKKGGATISTAGQDNAVGMDPHQWIQYNMLRNNLPGSMDYDACMETDTGSVTPSHLTARSKSQWAYSDGVGNEVCFTRIIGEMRAEYDVHISLAALEWKCSQWERRHAEFKDLIQRPNVRYNSATNKVETTARTWNRILEYAIYMNEGEAQWELLKAVCEPVINISSSSNTSASGIRRSACSDTCSRRSRATVGEVVDQPNSMTATSSPEENSMSQEF